MDDIDALEQLARRMNPVELCALITRIALRASARPGEMAENLRRGGTVRGDWASPHWDMDLTLALRQCATLIEGRWAADANRRQAWNDCLSQQYHPRRHRGHLRELSPEPGDEAGR